ncbi:MAG: hypothetical protein ACXU97_09050, partial [Thermodesulfobacteriota bacterium]
MGFSTVKIVGYCKNSSFGLKSIRMESKDYLDAKAVVIVIIMTLLWGFNYPAIKYSNQGVSPVFASTLRSMIASICGLLYCLKKKEKLFHTDVML